MTNATPHTELVITRVFNAPRAMVYRAFTDPDQLAEWFGPVGFTVPRESVELDVKVGGHQRLTMVSDSDPSMTSPVNATYTEVVENELLVGVEKVEGIPGFEGISEMYMRAEFHDDESGGTRLVIRQGPYTPQVRDMAEEGWNSSFTKLEALLSR